MNKSTAYQSLLVLLFLFCTSVLSIQLVPVNAQGIKGYAGFHDYREPVTKGLLIREAKDAYRSQIMTLSRNQRPSVLAALWTGGSRVYFASSVKGPLSEAAKEVLKLNHPRLRAALEKCSKTIGPPNVDAVHNNDEKCGEIMVIAKWLSDNKKDALPPTGKLIVAVELQGTMVGVKAPCATGARTEQKGVVTFGCSDILPAMGFSKDEIITSEETSCDTTHHSRRGLDKRACRKARPMTALPKSTKDKNGRKPKPAPAPKLPKKQPSPAPRKPMPAPKKPMPAPKKQMARKPAPPGRKGRRALMRKRRSVQSISRTGT